MTAGGALRTKAFVVSVFETERWRFGMKREEGAPLMKGGDSVWSGLRTLWAPWWEVQTPPLLSPDQPRGA